MTILGTNLIIDFFLNEAKPLDVHQHLKESQKQKLTSPSSSATEAKPSSAVSEMFEKLKAHVNEDMVQKTGASFQFMITGVPILIISRLILRCYVDQ